MTPRFPPEHAFVVQFSTEATSPTDQCVGRVEHVVSGRGARFQTQQELLQFMAQVLSDVVTTPQA